MKCPWDADQLWEFVADRAGKDAGREIAAHASACAPCGAAIAEMRRLWALLERDAVCRPAPRFVARVLAAAGVRPSEGAPSAGRVRPLLRVIPWAAAAAVLLAFWVGDRQRWQPPGGRPSDEEGSITVIGDPDGADPAEKILAELPPQERELVAQLDLLENLDAAQAMDLGADDGWALEYVDDLTNLPDEEDF